MPAPQESFAVAPAGHPNGFYFDGNDALRLTVLNALTGVSVRVRGRFLHVDGRVERFERDLTPATDRTASTVTFALGEGWLLNAQALASAATPIIGQTFAKLSVIGGLSSVSIELATLCQDYLTAVQPVAWPGSGLRNSLMAGSALRSITGTNPAAGIEVIEVVPTGVRWRLLGLWVSIATDGTVANRRGILRFDNGTTNIQQFHQFTVTPASASPNWVWQQGWPPEINFGNSPNQSYLPPHVWLPGGHRIVVTADSFQAGDNFGAPIYLVEEVMEGA